MEQTLQVKPRARILTDIFDEMDRQDAKWGAQRQQSDLMWQCILTEEVGEAAREVLERNFDNLYKENIQCMAVLFQWMIALLERNGTQEKKVL